jgi:hypothetical protein
MLAPGIGQKIAKQHGITFAGFCRPLLRVIILALSTLGSERIYIAEV